MIRVIVRTDDANMASHVGNASVDVTYRTFDISHEVLEAYLREKLGSNTAHRQVIGVCLTGQQGDGA